MSVRVGCPIWIFSARSQQSLLFMQTDRDDRIKIFVGELLLCARDNLYAVIIIIPAV